MQCPYPLHNTDNNTYQYHCMIPSRGSVVTYAVKYRDAIQYINVGKSLRDSARLTCKAVQSTRSLDKRLEQLHHQQLAIRFISDTLKSLRGCDSTKCNDIRKRSYTSIDILNTYIKRNNPYQCQESFSIPMHVDGIFSRDSDVLWIAVYLNRQGLRPAKLTEEVLRPVQLWEACFTARTLSPELRTTACIQPLTSLVEMQTLQGKCSRLRTYNWTSFRTRFHSLSRTAYDQFYFEYVLPGKTKQPRPLDRQTTKSRAIARIGSRTTA
ncbi:hypothetical protein DPMN_144448 [Dreissena polymorpha]|uniref:Uncharacterized protein n=1 Tax=Dreissena polymorpha TaxID=45954 RepID=A0A9D4GEN0_DREPO|nr:hypothetical protein DPMN_144448 [Dreissena polymorpha]